MVETKNIKLVILLGAILIFVTISCKQNKNYTSNYENSFIEKTKKFNKNLIGKQLYKLPQILGDSILSNSEKTVLLLTVGSDCSGCREKSYEYLKRINETFNREIAFVVGTGLAQDYEIKTNGLSSSFFQDENASIKQELNLFHTPSLVFLDNQGIVYKILSIFPFDHVEGYDEEKEFDKFVEKIIEL